MSKIGKKTIMIPDGVEVRAEDEFLHIKGPKGLLSVPLHHSLNAVLETGTLRFERKKAGRSKFERALWGTTASLAENAIEGVTKGFEKTLEVVGVGYRAMMEGNSLVLSVGFSHPVKFVPPETTHVKVEKNIITVTGVDKGLVGRVAAEIRACKKPEPYKGKGIKYSDEVIRRKAGKKVAGTAA